jgi:hypothetical protein
MTETTTIKPLRSAGHGRSTRSRPFSARRSASGNGGHRAKATHDLEHLTERGRVGRVGRGELCGTPSWMSDNANRQVRAEIYWPMVVVVMMFGFWARATYGVGLTAIIMGVWLLMGSVAGATWVVIRWNRWWVWGAVSVVFVILAAVALEFITIAEEF